MNRREDRFPELLAGGYSRRDGKVEFFQRIHALLDEREGPQVVVDFGAGRGGGVESPVPIHRRLQDLRRPGRTILGVDVDPVVRTNPLLDEAHVIEPGGRLPLADASVDLIVSEWTFEHVVEATEAAAELTRVLKPGGWICATTPNKWGYIALGARLVPNRLHVSALRRLQPKKAAHDTFPTAYRMNTRRDLRRLFPADTYTGAIYGHDAEPWLYAGGHRSIEALVSVSRVLPEAMRSVWMVFLQKRPAPQ